MRAAKPSYETAEAVARSPERCVPARRSAPRAVQNDSVEPVRAWIDSTSSSSATFGTPRIGR
jgi:hypothetical protein